jgi:hypothetical protein
LKLGVLDVASYNAFVDAIGHSSAATSISWQQAARSMVSWYNQHGGIAGRHIDMVEYTFRVTDPNVETDLQAACQTFTVDNHVDAVFSVAGVFSDSYETCLARAGLVNVEQSNGIGQPSYQRYPRLVSVGKPNLERSIAAVLNRLASIGFLTAKNKLGVIVEDCPYDITAWQSTGVPLTRKIGMPFFRRDTDCLEGSQNLSSYEAQYASDALYFHSQGADRIMIVSYWSPVGMDSFTNEAQNQGYHPWYLLDDRTDAGSTSGNWAQGSLPRMIGVGFVPDNDITARVDNPAVSRCRAMYAQEGTPILSKGDDWIGDATCDAFNLLATALVKVGGRSDGAVLDSALNSLGSMASALPINEKTYYDATHRDGQVLSAIFGYQSNCSCFVFKSSPSADP